MFPSDKAGFDHCKSPGQVRAFRGRVILIELHSVAFSITLAVPVFLSEGYDCDRW
jgi:hypothetical protein